MLLSGQEADAMADDEEMGPRHLPNQPQPAGVVRKMDAGHTQAFNDEIKSGEPAGSTTDGPAHGPPSGGSRAGPGNDGQLRQTAATPAAPNPRFSVHNKKWDDNAKK